MWIMWTFWHIQISSNISKLTHLTFQWKLTRQEKCHDEMREAIDPRRIMYSNHIQLPPSKNHPSHFPVILLNKLVSSIGFKLLCGLFLISSNDNMGWLFAYFLLVVCFEAFRNTGAVELLKYDPRGKELQSHKGLIKGIVLSPSGWINGDK